MRSSSTRRKSPQGESHRLQPRINFFAKKVKVLGWEIDAWLNTSRADEMQSWALQSEVRAKLRAGEAKHRT
jgi:hypothetical protein